MKSNIKKTNDIFLILAMNNTIFPGDDLDVRQGLYCWIANCNTSGKPIGFCTLTDIGHKIGFLSRAGVIRDYRGHNLQRRFIRIRERFAKKLGLEKVITYVHNKNYSSLANLIKCGYIIYEPEYDYAGKEFIYLMKVL